MKAEERAARRRAKRSVSGQRSAVGLAIVATLGVFGGVASGQTAQLPAPPGYLSMPLGGLGFTLPPPPSGNLDIERNQVLSAQTSADRYAKDEAFADAEAYLPDNLMQRFSVVAGETLNRTRRPILAHMLFRIWRNLDSYSTELKKAYPRQRPFVGDPTLQPCDVSYLQPSNGASYPSGHAADGYVAALVLVEINKGSGLRDEENRADAIMARGVRFGTNRMVCGVHYPSDVAAGQAFAKALYGQIVMTADFKADLACAKAEDLADHNGVLGKPSAYPGDCLARATRYATEDHFS